MSLARDRVCQEMADDLAILYCNNIIDH